MPIDPEAVGSKGDPVEHAWGEKDVMLYALGVGADTSELQFTTENTSDTPLRVLPTMAVVLGAGSLGVMGKIGAFNPAMLVHGEQAIELFGEIPVSGRVSSVGQITGIWDKGKGAVVVSESVSTDVASGQAVVQEHDVGVHPGRGGWGGDRGPSGNRNVAPERQPDHQVTYRTRDDQALIYRLSGDRNPLHSDPQVRRHGWLRSPDPARPVHVRVHGEGVGACPLRRRSLPFQPDGGALLLAGDAGRGLDREDVGRRRRGHLPDPG